MSEATDFDAAVGHRYFSANAYNHAWGFIDLPQRTVEETEDMLHAAHASFWHWSQRPDLTTTNLSIGYWQLARVYTLTGDPETALRYPRRCLETSAEAGPFYEGYAHEAFARAEAARGDMEAAEVHHARGLELAAHVTDAEDRAVLEADLRQLV